VEESTTTAATTATTKVETGAGGTDSMMRTAEEDDEGENLAVIRDEEGILDAMVPKIESRGTEIVMMVTTTSEGVLLLTDETHVIGLMTTKT
jgi:hypothetical protein